MNNKGADLTAQIHRMFCAFVVRIHVQQSRSFLMLRPKYGGMVFNPGQRVKCKKVPFLLFLACPHLLSIK